MLIRWLVNACTLMLVAYLVPGIVVSGLFAALVAAVVIGLVNATIGIFLKVITFPLTVVTLGIFWLVINALMLMLASAIVPGFQVSGFWAAFFGALLLSIINSLLKPLYQKESQETRQ